MSWRAGQSITAWTGVILWAAAASAETPASLPATPAKPCPAASQPAKSAKSPASPPATAPSRWLVRKGKLPAILNAAEYPPCFVLGAQAELASPLAGTSSVIFGYEAGWMEVEASAGIGWSSAKDVDDVYILGLRVAVPMHRGVRADFAPTIGGAVELLRSSQTGNTTVANVVLGARLRFFNTPNLATVATVGLVVALSEDGQAVVVGARPLGSAGLSYYFR